MSFSALTESEVTLRVVEPVWPMEFFCRFAGSEVLEGAYLWVLDRRPNASSVNGTEIWKKHDDDSEFQN